MADLTDEELRFLYTQRIDESAVMDCSWMRPRRYKWAMEEGGYLWCISPTYCYNGHRLRSRPGHCIQCDTSRIAFVKRHHDAAYIYIAGSLESKVVKVGNAIWPERRVAAPSITLAALSSPMFTRRPSSSSPAQHGSASMAAPVEQRRSLLSNKRPQRTSGT